MPIWQLAVTLDMINERGKNTMVEALGIVFTEIGDDFLVARLTVANCHRQPLGIMHGGTSCVLAETVGSTAANLCVDRRLYYCVGLDINTNHIHSVTEGELIGVAKPYHIGKSTQVWGIEIKTGNGRLVSVNRLTMAVLMKQPEQ